MKKLVLFAILLTLLGCKKDEPEKTTYQITNNTVRNNNEIEYLDGTLWEVVVFCYSGDDIVKQDNLSPVYPDGGVSQKIEVADNVTKVKVSFKLLPPASPYYNISENNRKYVVAFTSIVKEQNNSIVIDGKTMVSGSLKSADFENSRLNNVLSSQQSAISIQF